MRHFTSIVVFTRVAEGGSLAAAANDLGISKPTVSKHLATLEQHLQARLLRRTTRGVSLTTSGRRFYEHCRKIMADLGAAEAEAVETSTAPRGPLKVVAPHCVGQHMLIPQLPGFLRDYPDIHLELSLREGPVDPDAAEFDLAVQILDTVPAGFASLHLSQCEQILCAAPGYLDRHGTPASPDDLEGHQCLAWADGPVFRWILDGPQGRRKLPITPLARMDSADALRAMAVEGGGIALLPAFVVKHDIAAGRLVRLLPDHRDSTYELRALFADSPQLPRKVEVFLDYLRPRILPRQSAA